jgi:hypothetical protein
VVRLFKYSLGSAAVLVTALAGLGGLNLYTYQRFTSEAPVAALAFERVDAKTYRVEVRTPGGTVGHYELQGDEWQLDVRMIKWRDWLTFLGEDPLFRLDRISGRYISTEDALSNPLTTHPLAKDAAVDLWAFARRAGDWLPGVDAAYGSSVYLPMRDGAVYRVSISPTGLLARAVAEEQGQ